MQTLVKLEGVPEEVLEVLVKRGYFKTKTEAIRAGILTLGKEYSLINPRTRKIIKKEGAKPSAIVVLTETGRSVRLLSRLRPILPIIALTQSEKVRDELCLTWGVTPYYLNLGHERLELSKVFRFLKENQIVGKGQLLIILSGEITGEPGRTNMVTLKEVWE